MARTIILVDDYYCFASSSDKKVIRRWKRCLESSKTPFDVLEDCTNEQHGTFSIKIPHGLGQRSSNLLIPSVPEKLSEEERLATLDRIRETAEEIPYDREDADYVSE